MTAEGPIIFWFRRDFRLADHPGLTAALESGTPVLPVFILDAQTDSLGAAPKWRLGEAVRCFAETLSAMGTRLVIRKGEALEVLRELIAETGAQAVHWSRAYDPDSIARDKALKAALKGDGIEALSHPGHLLFEPWTVETGQGGFYKVFTPMWKAVRGRDPGEPLAAPESWPGLDDMPRSLSLNDLQMGREMNRGARIVARHACVGEAAARDRLDLFLDEKVARYKTDRDRLDRDGTSGLSENLAVGEISPRQCWAAGHRAMAEGAQGAEDFVRELVWREFAYHLIWHTPEITHRNWRPEWDAFPWAEEGTAIARWQQGRTGEPVIDAAMRQLYVTGTMHNRARMLVASYLTKHLLVHWKVGLRWFEDCLIDWDPASNAMGWQWAAGCGPDAAPYFRIFNPATQAEKFDPKGAYRRRYLAEFSGDPGAEAQEYFEAIPKSWSLSADDPYPDPLIGLKEGRQRALDAYEEYKHARDAA